MLLTIIIKIIVKKYNQFISNRRVNITHKTIDALISLALKKPRICFKHSFNVRKYEENSDSDVIDMKSYDSLPQNMKLTVYQNDVNS